MKHHILLILIVLLWVSIMPLMAQEPAAGFPLTVVDGEGRELTFEEPPQRVIALWNGNYGQVAALGVRPVATAAGDTWLTDATYFLPDGASIPSVENAEGDIDLELVASFEPDLIIALDLEEAHQMESIAPVYVNAGLNNLAMDGYKENLRTLGHILAKDEAAETAITAFENRLDAYQQMIADEPEPTALVFRAWGDQAFYVYTVATPVCLPYAVVSHEEDPSAIVPHESKIGASIESDNW